MSITVNEGGVLKELETISANENGVLYELDTVHSNENGVLYEIFSGALSISDWVPSSSPSATITNNTDGSITISAAANAYVTKTFSANKDFTVEISLTAWLSSTGYSGSCDASIYKITDGVGNRVKSICNITFNGTTHVTKTGTASFSAGDYFIQIGGAAGSQSDVIGYTAIATVNIY